MSSNYSKNIEDLTFQDVPSFEKEGSVKAVLTRLIMTKGIPLDLDYGEGIPLEKVSRIERARYRQSRETRRTRRFPAFFSNHVYAACSYHLSFSGQS